MGELRKIIRNIPNFPKSDILFRDITPLLGNAESFRKAIDMLGDFYNHKDIDAVIAIESRGFILGSALAYKLGTGLVLVCKGGRLPYSTYSIDYTMGYGSDRLEIHRDALKSSDRVLIVDDVLSTGGTVSATIELLNKFPAEIVGLSFLIEIEHLNGRQRLKNYNVKSIIKYTPDNFY